MSRAYYKRPLSPHLQVYRPQLTSVLSIIHRLTGMALSLGSFFLIAWVGALAMGQESYHTVSQWFTCPIGITFLMGWAFCFYFHFANGIRHLFWDAGWGYGLGAVYRSGWIVVGFAALLTILTYFKVMS
jgi:succinate dehydrogenase / fumarate reductase cytochrome b subunit